MDSPASCPEASEPGKPEKIAPRNTAPRIIRYMLQANRLAELRLARLVLLAGLLNGLRAGLLAGARLGAAISESLRTWKKLPMLAQSLIQLS